MSKGKRRSNPEALKIVRERLRCGQTAFTEADRELLMQLCRLDLIHILEVDLALGPLKSSQKNSVACMVSSLLSQQQQQDVQPVLDAGAALGRAGGSPVPETQRNSRWSPPAAAADVSLLFPGADGQGRSPSSGGGSCPTPSTAPDEQPLQQLLRPQTPMSDALGAPAPAADQPWLAELHEQLEAAGTMRYRLGDDTTDTDDDTNGTGATSSWVGEDLDDQQQFAVGGSQGLGPPLDTSTIEEMLVQQLLLDMNAVPRHRAHRDRSFNSRLEQHDVQQQEEEAQREPPPLLQQKLQQLDEQQRLLKEQQRMQQERQQQELMRQRQQQQQQLQREMRQQAEFDQMLQDELLQQLQAREAPQPLQPQLDNSGSLQTQQLVMGAVAAVQLSPIAAAPMGFCGLQQHRQITTWPLPGLPPAEPGSSVTAAAPPAAAGLPGAAGLPFHGLSDASLPLPTPAWRPGRTSVDGGSGSFTRKREKVLMDLPTLQDEGPTGSGDDPQLSVEPSGPSAELPTKRRSITLPGCTEVAALPTSFSGKVAGPAGMQRPQPTDLQQLMQLSSCDDPADVSWQMPQQMQQQYQQQLPGAQVGLPQSGTGMSGITSKLKTLLRGHKLKAKARRCNTVGAGGSFSAAAGADTNRIPSADAALALQAAAAAAAGGSYPDQPYPQQMAGQQLGTSYGPGHYAAQSSGLYMQGGLAPRAQDRQWHSTGLPAVGRNPSDCSLGPPVVGGFSWHASGSTMLPPGVAGMPQQGDGQHMAALATAALGAAPAGVASSSSQFAQQLAQLRAEYGQQQETCGPLYPMQGSCLHSNPMPAQALPPAPGTSDPAGLSLECYAGAGADTPERLVTTGYSGDKSGIVGKLVRALKIGSNPAQASGVLGPTGHNPGGMEVCEEDEQLLIMGRTDGETDLARALQWPESGALNPREEVLQALGLHVQGESRAGAGAGEDGPSIGMQ